jgi:hypothetical protein
VLTLGGVLVPEGTVTFVVSALAVRPGARPIVLGQVRARVNAQGVATATLLVAAGSPGGGYTIDAFYIDIPGGVYLPASGTGTLTINPAPTTLTLHDIPTVNYNSKKVQTVVLTVDVQSPTGTVATGTVTFTLEGQPPLTATVDKHGKASVRMIIPAGMAPGKYTVTATYADQVNAIGGVNFGPSAMTATLIIRRP